jgi:hypothetical protein
MIKRMTVESINSRVNTSLPHKTKNPFTQPGQPGQPDNRTTGPVNKGAVVNKRAVVNV